MIHKEEGREREKGRERKGERRVTDLDHALDGGILDFCKLVVQPLRPIAPPSSEQQPRSNLQSAALWNGRFHIETLIIHKITSREFTTQDDVDQ